MNEGVERAPNYRMPRKPQESKQYYIDKYGLDSDDLDRIEIFLKMNSKNGNFDFSKNLNRFVENFLESNYDREKLFDLFKSNDKNNDGILSYDEFMLLFKSLFADKQ